MAQSKKTTAETPFTLGVVDKIVSKQLSETRTLNIYLPDNYNKDTSKSFPVIYLLDGSADEDFIHVCGVVQFLNMIQAMPNTIVVGIANVDRKRDFTFPTTIDSDKRAYPTTGHSGKFISFIEKELQPYIEHKYRCTKEKTIIGQSLGGLLASEIILKKPELFTKYVIVSPSLWWDAESLLKNAQKGLPANNAKDIEVYLTIGTEGKVIQNDAEQLVQLLKQQGPDRFYVLYMPLPDENHLTILHNAVYQALRVLNK